MAYSKRHRKNSSRRHKKYGHRGGFTSLSPATFSASPSTQTTANTSNSSIQPPYNAMGSVSSNTNLGSFFRSGAVDQSHINPNIMNAARNGQALVEMEGGSLPMMNLPQQGGVWNKMIGDAIAPLVLLGLQQYYNPRNKSGMNKKMRKGKMTKKNRK